jgi:hypothetical protein
MSVLRKTDLVQHVKTEIGGHKSSEQEHNDDIKTNGVATYGSLRARCLS